MYYSLDKTIKKLNISETDLLHYRSLNHIKYSEKTDKYDIDSILAKRTMTIGLEKHLDKNQKENLLEMMQSFSSLKFKLVKDIQHGIVYKDSGTNRLHRTLAKKYHKDFGGVIADSALSSAKGITASTETWYKKSIKNLEDKILKIRTETAPKKHHKNFHKGKRKKLSHLENRLAGYQSKTYLPIHFGKSALNDTEGFSLQNILKRYRKKRLELFINGNSKTGNDKIKIEYGENGYNLKLFKDILTDIKLPKSHDKTFTLENFNRQASRIAYNKNGKLVLHITYSYIKPLKKLKSKGTIGIDIGPKEIAVAYVKNDGNPLCYEHYPIGNLLDKRSADTQRELSEKLNEII